MCTFSIHCRRTALTAALLVLAASPVFAQYPAQRWDGYRDVHHRNDCRLAAQILTHGQPANKREWAMSFIRGCGPLGGEAIGHLFRRHRAAEKRTPELEEVTLMATRMTDRSIYEAAMEIAQDPTAGTVARVQAIRAIFYQITPGSFAPYEDFVDTDGLPIGISTYHARKGEPLPENVFDEIVEAMQVIQRDASAPKPVRIAAWQVEHHAQAARRRGERTGW